ncbi:glycosyltransferase [Bosea sp. NBC_00550]|uniref:glycosyltransferase n=1 Tax=Bosea sp. NBC_00550 TaxID=2969621 RepID=UPI002232C6CA|nr:glycosyltransferase family 2 protein [Bosea sp. NBC_00550]UZF90748.1 glycosyltransferase family 2 protein [Bosea sp. NBC_00550]
MLSLAPVTMAVTAPTQLELHRLGGSVFLLCWTLEASPFGKPSIALTGGGRRLAAASVSLGLRDGRERLAIAFRSSGHDNIVATLSDHGPQGDVTAAFDPALVHGLVDPRELLKELAPQARLTLANALVRAWPPLFGLSAIPNYLSFLRQLLLTLFPKPAAMQPTAALVEGRWLFETIVPADFGELRTASRLDGAGLARLDLGSRLGTPDRSGKRELHLVLEEPPIRGGGLLILQGERSLVVRALPGRQAAPSLGRWWAGKAASRDGLRNWVVEQLAGLSEQGRLLAVEMQRRVPLAVQHVRRNDDLPAAELDLAVCNGAGLLIGGWLRDPDDLLEEVLLHRGAGEPIAMLSRLQRFPVRLPTGAEGETRAATGFAAFASDYAAGAPVLQPRCEIKLKSGTTLTLRPPVQPADATTIRAKALSAIPPQYLTSAMLEATLAPILAACQDELRENRPEPVVKDYGRATARPKASVVIPLYRVYDFLRVQVSAFAGDPWFVENAELIYVLDSPEHEAEVAHLLGGLFLAYGLPMRLVVMGRNGGFSAACNAGARQGRGEALALVNSDVIPAENGWLPALIEKLDRRGRVGAVGPKLLYDDGSLQHAGLYFKRDSKGTWLNHHYFKGMPGGYAPANVERPVPGVTGACIVISQALFTELGGFDESYVIGDYEDSDLCLKVRRAGFGIVYAPGVALYHLERQSIARSVDYTRGAASQHNAWLQTRRWDAQIDALMQAFETSAAEPALHEPAPSEPNLAPRFTFRRATAA